MHHGHHACPQCRAGLCNCSQSFGGSLTRTTFLCPRCRAGLCNGAKPVVNGPGLSVSMPSMSGRALQRGVSWGSGGDDGFLCPRCRAGLCKGCLPRAAVTWAFGVRRAILAGTLILGKGFGPIPGSRPLTRAFPRANRGPIRLAAASVYRAHVMIQKSWRSSIIRAPRTTTPPAVLSPRRVCAPDPRPRR
jgi:hypothetical protein